MSTILYSPHPDLFQIMTKVADGENLWLNKEIPYQFDELSMS